MFRQHYSRAPSYAAARSILENAFAFQDRSISELNIRLVRSVCASLGIRTELLSSRDLRAEGAKTDRLIDILRKVGASRYLSGASAEACLRRQRHRAGIQDLRLSAVSAVVGRVHRRCQRARPDCQLRAGQRGFSSQPQPRPGHRSGAASANLR
jgi:hypothetical protein